MSENELKPKDMVALINSNGGNLKRSGLNHWMSNPPRNRPDKINTMALEIILKGKIKFISNKE